MRKCQCGCCELPEGAPSNAKWCIKHRCKRRFEVEQARAEVREFWCQRDRCHLIRTTNAKTKFCRPCRCYQKHTAERLQKDPQVLSAQEVLSWKSAASS
jgi:hypothetical protein